MGIIIGIIVVGAIAWLAIALLGALFGGAAAVSDANKEHADEENAGEILDRIFDGSTKTVVHTKRDSRLTLKTLVEGASSRGYRLVHSGDDTSVFERETPAVD